MLMQLWICEVHVVKMVYHHTKYSLDRKYIQNSIMSLVSLVMQQKQSRVWSLKGSLHQ
jgi:hypothetical protein